MTGIVETHVDEIYVSASEIEKWFPIDLELNFNELRLYMTTTEDLPFQALATRRASWKRKAARASASKPEDYSDAIILPYKTYAAPAIQLQQGINSTLSDTTDNHVATTSVQTQGDLFGMFSRFNLGYSQGGESDGFQNSYFNLSRRDPRSNLAGPLKATELEIGDITANALPLVNGLQRGRGIRIGNTPYNFVRDPDQFVIEGFGPEGWDVEVYQDEQLLSFQTIELGGRYFFEGLQLREGFNLFRIVLYGPNGEKEVRFERYYLGRNMVEKGKFIYDISALQSSTPLLNFENAPETDPTLSLYGEYGLGKNVSVNAGYYTSPLNGGTLNALGSGIRFGTGSAFYQFSTLYDASGGYSLGLNTTANLSTNIILSGGHEMHESYDENLRPVVADSFINFSQRFSEGFLKFGSYGLGARRRETFNGNTVYSFTNTISASLFDISATNKLEYEMQDTLSDDRFFGNLTLRRRTPIGMFRGRLNYSLDEGYMLDSTDLLFQTYIDELTSINLLLNSSFGDNQENTISAALTRRFDKFQLSTNASYSDTGEIQLGLLLSMNFIPQSLSGDYYMTGNNSE
ncbi:MAG: hypothetical protein MK052_07605, partial [Alphaproteobacteria bacterium]|nr:hypothetical protein [Alphaproteobacteria bacterium]